MKILMVRVLGCALSVCICIQTSAVMAQNSAPRSNRPFIDAFQSHWATAKGLALAVADAMQRKVTLSNLSPPR